MLLALTPWMAGFFAMPELRILVPVLAIMVAFDGFSTTGRATLFGTQQFRAVSLLALGFHVAKTVLVGVLWWTRHGLVSLALGLSALTVLLAVAQAALALRGLRHAARPGARRSRRAAGATCSATCSATACRCWAGASPSCPGRT